MAKITKTDIDDLQLESEMFNLSENDYTTFVNAIITEQSALLQGRIGTTAYDDVTTPQATYVKRAEKCMVAAELLRRRKNRLLAAVTANGQEFEVKDLNKQIADYSSEAGMWITKVAAGMTSDSGGFSSGTLVSSHFGDDDA